MKKTVHYLFAYFDRGRTIVGTYQDACEAGAQEIAAVKTFRTAGGKEVSRDDFVSPHVWVKNDDSAPQSAIEARENQHEHDPQNFL